LEKELPPSLNQFDALMSIAFLPADHELSETIDPRRCARASAFLTGASTPSHRVCVIAERGWKTRIVSAPPLHASIAGFCLNRSLLRLVKGIPQCRRFLEGDRRLAVEEAVRFWKPGSVFASTDLTAASDCLPLDLVRAVVDGLLDGWEGLPPVWGEALRSLTGPQNLTYPDGTTLTSSRGILMGLGPTWPLLSIIHLFWVKMAAIRVGPWCYRFCRSTAIGGDDLIGCWPQSLVDQYRRLVAECGGSFSKGKAYFTTRGGNFTEMTFWVTPERFRPTRGPIQWARGIPVRGLVSLSLNREGEAFESVGFRDGRDVRARRVLRSLRPEVWRRCRENGIPACFPRSLGGAGLPPRKGATTRVSGPRWLRLAVGRFLYGHGYVTVPKGPPSWVQSQDPAAVQSRRLAELGMEEIVAMGVYRLSATGDPTEMRVSDYLEHRTARNSLLRVVRGSTIPSSRAGTATSHRFARGVRGWARRMLRGGVPGALAIKNNRNSRLSLLARAAENRRRWRIIPIYAFLRGLPSVP
jgi:hypothetical protein